ncbi:MAG TPA: Gfo/Idh/MocA family oxidoreductase [Nitrososphaerales archaeon]|nr:Gfo/Idh/MocA family oxidoreductase [Nitrososphaerales archaeon]
MLKVGVVGLGKMGLLHAGTVNMLQGCSVVAFCEKEALLTSLSRKVLLRISFHNRVQNMMRQEQLDAVYVTTPTPTHLTILNEIVDNSRDVAVFVEKPLAGTYSESLEILEKTNNRINMIGFQKRFSPPFMQAKQLLEKQALGELASFRAYSFLSSVFSEGRGWRFGSGQGGALLDLGSHLVDLVLWYFGEPTTIRATKRTIYSKAVEDYVNAELGFESGVTGQCEVSWSVPGYRLLETRIDIVGNNGTLVVSDDYLRMEIIEDIPSIIKSGRHYLRKPELYPGVDFLIGEPEYCLEDKYFLDCVKSHTQPRLGLDTGVKVSRVIQTIYESANG